MRLGTMWDMMGGRDMRLTLRAFRMMEPLHRIAWLGAAARHGLLARLAAGPCSFEVLASEYAPDPRGHEALRAWLRHGCLLREIRLREAAYELRGSMAKGLADPAHARLAAYVEALNEIHHRGIYGVMDRLAAGESLTLADLDAPLVARVAQMLAPVLREVVDDHVPGRGEVALLELGCGAGPYLEHACARNPDLTAVGVDFDPEVAEVARVNLARRGFDDRVEVLAADLRTIELPRTFDVVTMFNLIYYFPVAERGEVIEAVARHVAPGGKLVITSSCHAGTIANNMLDVWFSAMPECGPLPEPDALVQHLSAAGLTPQTPRRLVPGEEYRLFVATR
jgi:SAM-dependent methyltransferase